MRDGSVRLLELKIVWGAVSVAEGDSDELEMKSVEPFDVTVEVSGGPLSEAAVAQAHSFS